MTRLKSNPTTIIDIVHGTGLRFRTVAEIPDEIGVGATVNTIIDQTLPSIQAIRIAVRSGPTEHALVSLHAMDVDTDQLVAFHSQLAAKFTTANFRLHSQTILDPQVTPRDSVYFADDWGMRWLNREFDDSRSVYISTDRLSGDSAYIIHQVPARMTIGDRVINTTKIAQAERGVPDLDPFEPTPLSLQTRLARLSASYNASVRHQMAQLVGRKRCIVPRWSVGHVLAFPSLVNDPRFENYRNGARALCALSDATQPRFDILSSPTTD